MHISKVTLWVEDLDRAIDFYTAKLGWRKMMDEPMGDGTRWVTISPKDGAQTEFALGTRERDEDAFKIGNSGVVLNCEDVHQTCKQLASAGVEITMQPEDMPWGGWAMFKDSEGNTHGLYSMAREGISSN